jgi:hypothetical protein
MKARLLGMVSALAAVLFTGCAEKTVVVVHRSPHAVVIVQHPDPCYPTDFDMDGWWGIWPYYSGAVWIPGHRVWRYGYSTWVPGHWS